MRPADCKGEDLSVGDKVMVPAIVTKAEDGELVTLQCAEPTNKPKRQTTFSVLAESCEKVADH